MLTLYRGDYEKIKKFDLNKTNKNCLYGRGIYLTVDPDIAQTYRVKGSGKSYINNVLWQGVSENRNVAAEFAFQVFAVCHVDGKNIVTGEKAKYVCSQINKEYKKLTPKQISTAKSLWIDVREELIIERLNNYIEYNTKSTYQTGHKVIWSKRTNNIGFVTKFKFPRYELEHNTVSMERSLRVAGIQEIFDWDNEHHTLIQLIEKNCIRIADLRKVLEPWGYLGISHMGGIRGGKAHRVFVLWDDQYVNRHKVGLHL